MKAKGGLVLWSSCDKHYTHAPLLTHIITYLGQVHVLFFPWKHRGLKIRKKVPFSEDVLLFASKAKINVFWKKKILEGLQREPGVKKEFQKLLILVFFSLFCTIFLKSNLRRVYCVIPQSTSLSLLVFTDSGRARLHRQRTWSHQCEGQRRNAHVLCDGSQNFAKLEIWENSQSKQ